MVNILVVDDKNTRRLLEAVLTAENYNVFTAVNGEDALEVMDGSTSTLSFLTS